MIIQENTSNGQLFVNIPKELSKFKNLVKGMEVDFVEANGEIVLKIVNFERRF